MRAFLRLEHLFRRFEHQIAQCDESKSDDVWFSRIGVESIIDILTILGRMDIRSELAKELERQTATFEILLTILMWIQTCLPRSLPCSGIP
ncbi:MAG: cell division protein ZapD [Gammaproteobacteria bacterium]|nr:cell division protein ZapD [Gammaproteobacteria bacterium]